MRRLWASAMLGRACKPHRTRGVGGGKNIPYYGALCACLLVVADGGEFFGTRLADVGEAFVCEVEGCPSIRGLCECVGDMVSCQGEGG